MNLLESLNWRYAAKTMNGTKVPKQKIDFILESIRLTPTSFGLQALKVLVIESDELKYKIYEHACKQTQVMECSHLLVFAGYKKITQQIVDEYIDLYATTRNKTPESLAFFKGMMDGLVHDSEENNFSWTSSQTYIALGIALAAAADQEVDSTPIEGFDPSKLDEILGLNDINLGSVLLLPLGYRDVENDKNATAPKVRKKSEDMFIKL